MMELDQKELILAKAEKLSILWEGKFDIGNSSQILEKMSLSSDKANILSKVLESELTHSYFNPNHFKDALKEKREFNYAFSTDVSKFLGSLLSTTTFKDNDNLFESNEEDLIRYSDELFNDGYTIFDTRINENICDKIIAGLKELDFAIKKSGKVIHGYKEENIYSI